MDELGLVYPKSTQPKGTAYWFEAELLGERFRRALPSVIDPSVEAQKIYDRMTKGASSVI